MLEYAPMEPIRTTKIPQGKDWVHEIKFDGVRGILIYEKDRFKLYSKNGNDITVKFPEIASFKDILRGDSAVIDGELTVWKNDRHSFHDILVRVRSSSKLKIKSNVVNYPMTYAMFDILKYNGTDLTKYPLLERKRMLKENTNQNNSFIYSDYFSDGNSLFQKVKDLGYEGIVSKQINSPYLPEKKHNYWYKIKVVKKILAVVGGVRIQGKTIKSLLLGIYKGDQLYYIGSASIGLSQKELSLLSNNLESIKNNKNTFINLSASKNTVFIKPMLTCWIKFLEWTNSGKLRHPQIIGFSDITAENAKGVEYSV